jgi:threonine dehydratase
VTRQDVEAAEEAIRSLFPATPLQLNEHLSARYGADIWLKREDLSPVRSYKIRGAFNFFRKVSPKARAGKTFVCASAGNHAQGFAFVCRHFGVPGVVFMPVTTPQQKIDKTRIFGAEFITIKLTGDFFDQCYKAAREHVEAIDGVMVPPFDHPISSRGRQPSPRKSCSSCRREPCRTWSSCRSAAAVWRRAPPDISTALCRKPDSSSSSQPVRRASSAASRPDEVVTLSKVDNFVDGAAVARIGDLNFAALRGFPADQVMLMPENAICVTISEMLNVEGVVLEPAGALSLTAIAAMDARKRSAARPIVAIVSGGNFDFERLPDVKERAMRYAGLKKYFILRMPQRPGATRLPQSARS